MYLPENDPLTFRWLPFDKSRNFPDLGQRFIKGEKALRDAQRAATQTTNNANANSNAQAANKKADLDITTPSGDGPDVSTREDMDDEIDLSWSAVMKRTFEAYLRQERPNMYGEWLSWERGTGSTSSTSEEDGRKAGNEKRRPDKVVEET